MSSQLVLSGSAKSGPQTELAVRGMNCGNCARHVGEAIEGVPGVASAAVELEEGRATIRWGGEGEVNLPAVLQAVKEAGYQAEVLERAEEGHGHDHDHSGHRK